MRRIELLNNLYLFSISVAIASLFFSVAIFFRLGFLSTEYLLVSDIPRIINQLEFFVSFIAMVFLSYHLIILIEKRKLNEQIPSHKS